MGSGWQTNTMSEDVLPKYCNLSYERDNVRDAGLTNGLPTG